MSNLSTSQRLISSTTPVPPTTGPEHPDALRPSPPRAIPGHWIASHIVRLLACSILLTGVYSDNGTTFVRHVDYVAGHERPNFSKGTIGDADSDGNGTIDFNDFLSFAGDYNSNVDDHPGSAMHDHDRSGVVDFPDFLIFASFFNQDYIRPQLPSLAMFAADSVFVDQDAEFSAIIADSPFCSVYSFNYCLLPQPDSLHISVPAIIENADTTVISSRITIGQPGIYTLIHTYRGCRETAADTLELVVLPTE